MTLLSVQFPPVPVLSSVLGPDIFFLSTLSSTILNPCSSLNVSGQVSHPYNMTDTIKVLYIVIFMFWDTEQKTEVQLGLKISISHKYESTVHLIYFHGENDIEDGHRYLLILCLISKRPYDNWLYKGGLRFQQNTKVVTVYDS
jgi:hypothetical protein